MDSQDGKCPDCGSPLNPNQPSCPGCGRDVISILPSQPAPSAASAPEPVAKLIGEFTILRTIGRGSMAPQQLPDEAVKNAIKQADIARPLVSWKDKGSQAELVGRENLRGGESQ